MPHQRAYQFILAVETRQLLESATMVAENGNGEAIQQLNERQIRPLTKLPEKLQPLCAGVYKKKSQTMRKIFDSKTRDLVHNVYM